MRYNVKVARFPDELEKYLNEYVEQNIEVAWVLTDNSGYTIITVDLDG